MEETLRTFHEKQAKSSFNKTWDYIDKKDRSEEDTLNMIHCAHASRYHWGEIGTPLHFERGEWLISKVYSILDKADQALFHAEACLKMCEENDIKDFDIVFAYEALANAYKLMNNQDQLEKYKRLAYDGLPLIKDKGDRDYAESELNKI